MSVEYSRTTIRLPQGAGLTDQPGATVEDFDRVRTTIVPRSQQRVTWH